MPRAPVGQVRREPGSSSASTCAGSAARCQAGSEMRAMNAPRLASSGSPATVSIRASAQEAEKP